MNPILIRLLIMGTVFVGGAFLAKMSVKDTGKNAPPEPEKPKADEPAARTPEQKAAAKKKREEKRAKEIAKAAREAAEKAVAEERARIAAETPKA